MAQAHHDLIVSGASAGRLEALEGLVRDLPPDLPAALYIVWHLAPEARRLLPALLTKAGPLVATTAVDGAPLQPGHIYVAPPDRHLVLELGCLRVTHGPLENRFRPAIDPLFRSAALAYSARVIGVILTGCLDDGTAGLWEVKQRGGLAVVQDPQDAKFPSMPQSARTYVPVDYCVLLAAMTPLLTRLVQEPVAIGGAPMSDTTPLAIETRIALEDNALRAGVMKLGALAPYTCLDCHGVLLQLRSGRLLRFRCHTGHAYTAQHLLAELTKSIEDTLWSTLRAMEESMLRRRHMAAHLQECQALHAAARFGQEAAAVEQRAGLVRQAVLHQTTPSQAQREAAHCPSGETPVARPQQRGRATRPAASPRAPRRRAKRPASSQA
jgi:two-component system, chemotaxis family, protein-glutamate methylesterase/glutaminase